MAGTQLALALPVLVIVVKGVTSDHANNTILNIVGRRKVRCTGTLPCESCTRVDAPCLYNAQNSRGRRPRIPPASTLLERPSRQTIESDNAITSATETEQPDFGTHDDQPLHFKLSHTCQNEVARLHIPTDSTDITEPPSRASPEPAQTDLQGHYVGPASGISFLLRVQKRLHHTSSFTFGDPPMPEFDPTFCVMIAKEETQMLLRRYFDFTVPVDRFLHRPTVEAWLQDFHETMGAMSPSENAPSQRAVLWMMFALAQDTLTPVPGEAVMKKRYHKINQSTSKQSC